MTDTDNFTDAVALLAAHVQVLAGRVERLTQRIEHEVAARHAVSEMNTEITALMVQVQTINAALDRTDKCNVHVLREVV